MKPKNQRLILVGAAIAAMLVAVLLAMRGLSSEASFYFTPADIASGKARDGHAARLGGMVVGHSIVREPDGVTIRFLLTDGKAQTPVTYRGIVGPCRRSPRMLCSLRMLKSSPVITVMKLWIEPLERTVHLLWVPG